LVRLLEHGKEEESREFLANLILSSREWSEVMLFLAENSDCAWNIDDLVLHIERHHKRKWSGRRRTKAAVAYRTILKYAGLIEAKGDLLVAQIPSDFRLRSLEYQEKGAEEFQKLEVASVRTHPTMLPSEEESVNYVGLNVPDSFMILVKKSSLALSHLRKQISADSYLRSWLERVEKELVLEKESVSD